MGLEQHSRATLDVRSTVAPLYVRTTKAELGLPAPLAEWVPVHMSDPQRLLYALLRDDILRRFAAIQPGQLPFRTRASVMRLLQVAIDPFTAVAGMVNSGFALPGSDFAEVCRQIIEEDWSPRMVEVERRVRMLVADGQKVVVWAPFVSTIERLANRFEDLGAMMIHGGVPAGDDADDDTREGIVRLFHSDPRRMVLVANPAAGGEGISLHQVCHNAVYIGRTYNAAHYLQSRDRIHRLGLSGDTTTRITIVENTAPNRVGFDRPFGAPSATGKSSGDVRRPRRSRPASARARERRRGSFTRRRYHQRRLARSHLRTPTRRRWWS